MCVRFRANFGTVPIKFWNDPRARKKLSQWRDSLATPSVRQADYMWSFMSAVFKLAVTDGRAYGKSLLDGQQTLRRQAGGDGMDVAAGRRVPGPAPLRVSIPHRRWLR